MKLIHTCHVQNTYSASNWSFEDTYKLLFDLEGSILEVGYFIHYKDVYSKHPIEHVIELPSSIGCPFRCAFCASSLLPYQRKLSSTELVSLFTVIYTTYGLCEDDCILVSFTGIGDFAHSTDEIISFIDVVNGRYANVEFTLSSCQWSPDLFLRADELVKKKYPIRYFQIAYIAQPNVLREKRIIPTAPKAMCSLDQIVEHIRKSDNTCYRINYVMIEGVNDDEYSFNQFASSVVQIRSRILIRISRMNITEASRKNSLSPPSLEDMQKFKTILSSLGVNSYLFYAEKNDNMNCGQLIANYLEK